MNAEDLESEELGVAEAIGLTFHGFDFGFIRRKRTSRRPQGSTGASSLFIDAPKPLAFLELRPSGNREEAPVLQVCVRAHANFG